MNKWTLIIIIPLLLLVKGYGYSQIVINEIMINPNGGNLPNSEYIELYNHSDQVININDYYLQINQNSIELQSYLLSPKQYLLLVPVGMEKQFNIYGNVLSIPRWYALSNTGSSIRIMRDNATIDEVNYTDSWYIEQSKKSGGWSLERINPVWTCDLKENWSASIAPLGGTPARPNSIVNNNHRPTFEFTIKTIEDYVIHLSFPHGSHLLKNIHPDDFKLRPNGESPTHIYIDGVQVILTFKQIIRHDEAYALILNPILICNTSTTISIQKFVRSTPAQYNDVVINEILFNPKVGGHDFVEIYNRSARTINLQDWKIGNRLITDDILLLHPNNYLAFTIDINNLRIQYPNAHQGQLYQVNSLPTYNNSQGQAILYASSGIMIDSLQYVSTMHASTLKNTKGISLERQSPDMYTNAAETFLSAATTSGGATPGYKNSAQREINAKKNNFFLTKKTIVTNPNFGIQNLEINYELTSPNIQVSVHIYSDSGTLVKRLISNQSLGFEGKIHWDGSDDYGQNVRPGHYILWVELLDKNGIKSTFKEAFVLI